MKAQTHWWIVVASIISVVAGAMLSHVIEPGVRVGKIMLATNTPALRIFPATPGPHPRALLAHGCGGSKEMLFRFGEALAAGGFECYSVDQAGFGESPEPCSLTNILRNFREAEQALGAVGVFIGHSMGGGVGAWSVREAGFRPKLFIGVGANGKLGEHGRPELLLFARCDEFRPLMGNLLNAQTNGRVIFPSGASKSPKPTIPCSCRRRLPPCVRRLAGHQSPQLRPHGGGASPGCCWAWRGRWD